MSEAAVQLVNLTKKYRSKLAVSDLNLDIAKGEVFGLLGPNGAGKTTTIKMIVGLISITAGDVLIFGHSIKHEFTKAIAHVGAIVENPEMYDFLTGYQNLEQFANMHPDITLDRIDEMADAVGLENRIHDKVQTYSLGMRQRLGIAQAVLHRPSVLILDEPTNGLDPAGIKGLREFLRNLAQNHGVAVIVSSHLLAEMELMCDRFAIIQQGKLVSVQSMEKMSNGFMPYIFEVDQPSHAVRLIKEQFPHLAMPDRTAHPTVTTDRETIADITACLVQAGLRVYTIQSRSKTLEERFMEATEDNRIV
ncbi:MAG: ABC transporter ATP-binding protein [Acidobacteriota bacterium]